MFVNKGQMPHAKYGRDQCIGCLRRLGFGGDRLAKILHLHRSTVLYIIADRITEPRYEGHDEIWKKCKAAKRKITAGYKNPDEYLASQMEDIGSFASQDRVHRQLYSRKYRHLEARDKILKMKGKKKPGYLETQRRATYRRRGVPDHLIPEKGAYLEMLLTSLTPEEQKCLRRIRRKRDALRRLVTEVWKGKVGDPCAVYRVGCTVAKFRERIKWLMKPEWNELNYGTVWNFDHIKPCASFDVFDREHIKILNHYKNIRPLCVIENSLKGANLLENY